MTNDLDCPFCGAKAHRFTVGKSVFVGCSDVNCANDLQMRPDLWNTRPAPTVKVKALEWLDGRADAGSGCYYQVSQSRSGASWMVTYVTGQSSHTLGYPKQEGSAKAAAQADYSRRILAAIEPAP